MRPEEIARFEEARQADGTAEMILHGQQHDPACAEYMAERIADGWMTFAAKGSWANQACGIGLSGPVSDEDLDRLVEFYDSRGVEPRIEICTFADESFLAGLARRGFVVREFENVLSRVMDEDEDLDALLPHPPAEGLTIELVDREDEGEVLELAEVSTSGFRPKGMPLDSHQLKHVQHGLQLSSCDAYIARVDGRTAGGGSMETGEHCAALFGASVYPEHRRRGIQAGLILARMKRARDRGCLLVSIHSKPGVSTERNAERLGFRLAYCKALLVAPGEGREPSP